MRVPRTVQFAGALVVLALLLPLGASLAGGPTAPPGPPAAVALGPATATAAPTPGERLVAPSVTALYDWDPQPFILPPTFLADQVAGEGAVATTSDPLGTVLLFGGESPEGLTNLTITANQSTANWDVAPVPVAPSPRANASLATFGNGRYAVLFGGLVNLTTGATDNQTWVYDFANRTWSNRTGPVAPPARESAAFAVDEAKGVGVLEGGYSPSAAVGGGGASILWNDTWLLNLTTLSWSRANASGAPRPAFGASMVFVPPVGAFQLFGGCSAFCSAGLSEYRPGGNWSPVATSGDLPSARGGASMVWSASWNLSILFGGFVWGGNGYAPLNDSYVYDPVLRAWSMIVVSGGPSARFAAAATYLNANQCPGLLVVGGSTAVSSPPPDGWFLDSNPDYGNGCNNWGGDQIGGSGGGPGNCTATSSLSVRVVNSSSLEGIANATLALVGRCGSVALGTSPLGYANFSALPNETVQVVATAPGYHSNQTFVNLTYTPVNFLVERLDPLPVLYLRTFGDTYAGGTGPLGNVSVVFGSNDALGASDAQGYLNVSAFAGPQGPGTFFGYKAGFSNGSTQATVPWTGTLSFTVLLLADGALDVHVVEWPDLSGVSAASGIITPVGAYTYGGPTDYTADLNGWYNTTLPQGNYTVSAGAPGFASNLSTTRFLPWAQPTLVVVNLTARFASNLSVQLLDALTGLPIAAGNVTVGGDLYNESSASGWANFSEIRPPGRYGVSGSAAGYVTNTTSVDLTYRQPRLAIVLELTPLSPCPPHCAPNGNGTAGVYRLLPASGATLDLFLLAPVALGLAGAAYVLYLRRRSEAPS